MRDRLPQSTSDALLSGKASQTSVLGELLPYVWQKGRRDLHTRVVLAFIALVLAKLVTLAVPIAYKNAVDYLTGAEQSSGVAAGTGFLGLAIVPAMLIVAYGVGRILMVLFAQLRDVIFTVVTQNAVRQLANRTFRHLHSLSLKFHLERRTGGLNRVIERGVNGVDTILRMAILNMIPTAVELVMIAGLVAWYFGWVYVAVLFVMVVAYVWFTFFATEKRLAIRRDMNESDTEANSKAVDSLLNFETVKYFGNEDLEARRFDASMARYEKAAVRTFTTLGFLNSGQAIIFSTGMVVCMLLAARDVSQGILTVGDFVMINAILIQLFMPLNFMGMVYREIKQGLVDMETMFALLKEPAEIVDRPDAKPLRVDNGAIAFKNVSFAYEPGRPILKDISFEVPPGKMVAIVGPSGAGKSTISRILFRFYEVNQGEVTIDGQNIQDVTQRSLRAAIGMVPQDTVLFNDTIEYNIRYGRPDATEAEVHEAARLAQIDGFILALPQGYAALVGERGLKLSGGEKQRVAIARTILKAPPILMLDEATSALDSHTEKEIQDALEQVARDRTSLVIAHRLSTVVHADNIIVLDQGRIVEQGRHAELLAKDGLYASLWARQREADEAREILAHAREPTTARSSAMDGWTRVRRMSLLTAIGLKRTSCWRRASHGNGRVYGRPAQPA
ncbi:ABCB family ABC transporter ATP-binding protein/permease [Methyloceanibacter stevinii]|uniref:ABCB family ABC transporter ATP-binding protein/permease n=1 Tax=Methyloceanibacter stevinii TaxID=1774970 RepID=UPI00084988AB|nr:ABC transporter ATP-binding protein/permease [Methyloceanibacter stevinii]